MDFVHQVYNRLNEINDELKSRVEGPRQLRQKELIASFNEFLGASDHVEEISAYKLTCDDSNNPPSVVDANKVRIDVAFRLKSDPVHVERQMWFD